MHTAEIANTYGRNAKYIRPCKSFDSCQTFYASISILKNIPFRKMMTLGTQQT